MIEKALTGAGESHWDQPADLGTAMQLTLCFNCEYHNRDTADFCGSCGLPLSRTCPACNARNPGAFQFCDFCGTPLGDPAPPESGHLPVNRPANADHPKTADRPEIADPGLQTKPVARQRPRTIGTFWETPVPQWQWTRTFLRSWTQRNRWELLAVALLTVLAAFLRIYRLSEIPDGFHGDEAWNGIDALRILDEGWIGAYTPGALGNMTGAIYLTALTIWLLDASIFSVRFSMALFGIAAVPATHLLLRLGFGRWVALFGASVLAVSYWHMHFSRMGFQLVSLPLVATVAGVALLWAMRTKSHWRWLAAGAVLGLIPYTYLAFPSFFVAAAGTLAIYLFLKRDQLSDTVISLALYALGAIIVSTPFLLFLFDNWDVYIHRTSMASVFRSNQYPRVGDVAEKATFFATRAWESLTLLARQLKSDGVDGTGGASPLDFGMAALAYLGLALSIRKWRSPPYLFAALVVILAILAQVFALPESGTLRRSIAAVPFIAGLAAIGAISIVRLFQRRFGTEGRNIALAVVALTLLASSVWNVRYYFGELAQSPTIRFTFVPDHIDALAAAHSFESPGVIYFYSGRWSFNYESVRFLHPGSQGIDRSREFGSFELDKIHEGPVTYLLVGAYAEELDRLKELYPGGETIIDDAPQPRFIVYHLSS